MNGSNRTHRLPSQPTSHRRPRLWPLLALAVAGLLVGLLIRRSDAKPPAPPAPQRLAHPATPRPSEADSRPARRDPIAVADNADNALDQPDGPGIAPAPVYEPRDPNEWQGMRVNVALQASCDTSPRCGLAMACLDGRCGPCRRDDECGPGEACVLDHCLRRDNVACRSRRDCAGDEVLCVLSGYSSDTRGNADMRATCQVARGGSTPQRDDRDEQIASPGATPAARPGLPAAPTAVDVGALLGSLDER